MYFYGIGKQPPPLILSLEREREWKKIFSVQNMWRCIRNRTHISNENAHLVEYGITVQLYRVLFSLSLSFSMFCDSYNECRKNPMLLFFMTVPKKKNGIRRERKRIYMDFVYRFLSCFRLQLLSINIHLFPCKIILTPPKESRIIG